MIPKNYKQQIKKGAVIISENKTQITLRLPKKFSVLLLICWTILLNFIGTVGYLVWYSNCYKGQKVTYNK